MSRHHRGPAQVALAGTRECAICPDAAARDALVCTGHRDEIGHMLDPTWTGDPARRIPASIPVFWSQLDPTPGRAGGEQRRAPGFASAPPCALDPIIMTDPRSRPGAVAQQDGHPRGVWFTRLPNGKDDVERPHHEPDGQPRPVEVALANLASELWTRWNYAGPDLSNGDVVGHRTARPVTATGVVLDPDRSQVRALAGWLHAHRDRICADPDVAAVHAFAAEILRDLRHACGDRDEDPVGRCTAWLPRPGGERVSCGSLIYPPIPSRDPEGDGEDPVSTCDRCGAKYGKIARGRLALAYRDDRETVSA